MAIKEKPRRISAKSLANLRPQMKGEPSRNPKGRPPKADCLLGCIREELGKKTANGVTTNAALIASVLVAMASKGHIKAIELVLSYLHSKPTQGINMEVKADVHYVIGQGYKESAK